MSAVSRDDAAELPLDEFSARDTARWLAEVGTRIGGGDRFAGLYGTTIGDACRLSALLATRNGFDLISALVQPDTAGELHYPSLTPTIPSAFWYERAAHDLSGVVPDGHPRLDPLLLSLASGSTHPRPGAPATDERFLGRSQTPEGPVDVQGRGMFTMPLGPVRSGVFESIEFLVETPGEDIPHLNIRPHYKHRGVAKSFEGLVPGDAVLVAERVEGIASVAHSLAFSHAVERLADVDVPRPARLLRVLHAELERIANHLDVAVRLTEAAGLAVANARFGWHKESVLRLVGELCGSRFGRSVVVPGGVAARPRLSPQTAVGRLLELRGRIAADAALAMRTPSFLDRLRGTGWLDPERARRWGGLGPVGRAAGIDDDNRWTRPTDAYPELTATVTPAQETDSDVMARLDVRWHEIDTAFELALTALHLLPSATGPLRAAVDLPSGEARAVGWAEAPQGEAVHAVELTDGRVSRCLARSASLHNLVLFHDVFSHDVLTDFAFSEASFGLGYAGVAM